MATDLLTEIEKMRRVPGIVFADSPTWGRVARIAGTGLEVYEVIAEYRWNGRNRNLLTAAFHWLSEGQLHAALTYYDMFPDEIDRCVDALESFSLQETWQKFPFMKPD